MDNIHNRFTGINKLAIVLFIILVIVFVCFAFPQAGKCQILGLEPPSTKWFVIKTPHVEIIYEPQAKATALRIANIISQITLLDRRR